MLRHTLIVLATMLLASFTLGSWAVSGSGALPPALVGKWIATGGELDGATFDFFPDGRMVAHIKLEGRVGIINARVMVKDKVLSITTRSPITKQDVTKEQIIRSLTDRLLITEDEKGQQFKFERIARQIDQLPTWHERPAKKALIEFVRAVTDKTSPNYVPPARRIATFDNDGTLWAEQPLYAQLAFGLDRVKALAAQHPDWKTKKPFKAVLDGDHEAMSKFTKKDLLEIIAATHTGMNTEEFHALALDWLASAKHPRFKRFYPECVYQPMLEVMQYLRANGFKTYIVTGGGQDFVRAYAEAVYGVPPEQVVGTAGETKYGYDAAGRPILMKEPKLLLLDDKAGKPEGIHLMIGRRPRAAFGNSTGDKEMLEYTGAGDGARLMMLVLHNDATREYAYGPATGLPESKIGTFTQALYDEAQNKGWTVIRMKEDWKRIFSFEE